MNPVLDGLADSETMQPTSGARRSRWQEPQVDDYAAFYAAHPETRVSPDLLADLEADVRRQVSQLEYSNDPDLVEELRAELRTRIIEVATSFRLDTPDGSPAFDMLEQNRSYMIQRAAGKISSALRRERRQATHTVQLSALTIEGEDGSDGEELELPDPAGAPQPLARLEHLELRNKIDRQLSPAQHRVFILLDEGYSRSDIAQLLGLSRKTVHDHVTAIRKAAISASERSTLIRSSRRTVTGRPQRVAQHSSAISA